MRAAGGHDGGVIRELARVVPAPTGRPVRAEAAQGQERARRLAMRPGTWDRQEAAAMRAGFDAAAADWEVSRGGYRRPVLADALARGGPFRPGRAVEIASGTGLLTPLIAQVWPEVIAVDLSGGMLARSAVGGRIQADAARLPLAGGCAAAVVIGDGPLFAAEAARVMAAGAVLVWSNALGEGAPFFVPAGILAEAMAAATGRPWDAVCSQAHWGSWAVLRRLSHRGAACMRTHDGGRERVTLTDTDHRTQPSCYPVRRPADYLQMPGPLISWVAAHRLPSSLWTTLPPTAADRDRAEAASGARSW